MIEVFKGESGFANTYVISRFHECIIINPSHSYEQIIEFIGPKKLIAIFITETSKATIDQLSYYNVPIYLSERQYYNLEDNTVLGYSYKEKIPFNYQNLKYQIIEDGYTFKIADLILKTHIIFGAREAINVFEIADNLFVGSLFDNQKITKKAPYKSSIYDLKRSIQELLKLPKNYKLHHNFKSSNIFSNEILINEHLQRWI